MFKAARWKGEKNKIKAAFRMQFRATQVPQIGWHTLIVALVPLEIGKPTVKSEKAAVEDGTCQWENPIYETVRLIQETKTGKINDKIYQLHVFSGSSKTSVLGEATINFADYAEIIKPLSVSLPLKAVNSEAFLHVTIHRIQDAADRRDTEENGDVVGRPHGTTLESQICHFVADENNKMSNGNSDCKLNEDNSSITGQVQLNINQNEMASQSAASEDTIKLSSGSDAISGSSFSSSSGRDTPRTLGAGTNPNSHINHSIAETGWSANSFMGDNIVFLKNTADDNLLRRSSDTSVEKLKGEIAVLARQVEVAELELQTLRKQISKESRRANNLSREVCSLKEERDTLKSECEMLKTSEQNTRDLVVYRSFQFGSEDHRYMIEEIKQELSYEKNMNATLRLQLQKTQDSNSELILAVRDLEELLDQKNDETFNTVDANVKVWNMGFKHEMEEDKEWHDCGDVKADNSLQQKIEDLRGELEAYRRDHEELEMQMEQLALDYEILKQENHEMSLKLEQNRLQEQLKVQYECASSLAAMNELEIQVESLEEELKKQAEAFEADLSVVMRAKIDQEQRAVRAEAALWKTRWHYASAAERLQEEMNRLSLQMTSTFEANEKLAMQALAEASQLHQQKGYAEELLQKANENLEIVKNQYEQKLQNLSDQVDFQTKESDQLRSVLEDKAKELGNLNRSKEEKESFLLKDIELLKAEKDKLKTERTRLLEQLREKEVLEVEMYQMKGSIEKLEMLLKRGDMERDELVYKLSSLREEVEKLLKELTELHSQKDEKEKMVELLQFEVDNLKVQYNDSKHSLFEDEIEKENLRKQVFQLRADIRKKEDTINIIEKKLQESTVKPKASSGAAKPTSRNAKAHPSSHASKEVSNLKEKIKILQGELKQREAALESSTHSFMQKEKEMGSKIKELEKCMEKTILNGFSVSENTIQKDKNVKDRGDNSESDYKKAVAEKLDLEMRNHEFLQNQHGSTRKAIRSGGTQTVQELEVPIAHIKDQDEINKFMNETAILEERNNIMAIELKEMRERYSDISLKFAEVEGERQKLIMTIRNLKKAKY